MIEAKGDLWEYKADAKVITTNGFVRKDGWAVMGAGVARQAARMWPEIQPFLGSLLSGSGNKVYIIGGPPRLQFHLISFPVKHNWWEVADLDLIEESAKQLSILADINWSWDTVVLPRPGCGNGQRDWEEVKPRIEAHLDDRFHIIDLPKEKNG